MKPSALSALSHDKADEIARHFKEAGALFLKTPAEISTRLLGNGDGGSGKRIEAIVFDWDGVFHPGFKAPGSPAPFNEADSMGTNMLRYGLWRRHGKLPTAAIISGENNPTAFEFGRREHFDRIYVGIGDKRKALRHLCESQGIEPSQIAFVFDDINDLGMAEFCGLRFMIRRNASPLLLDYAIQNDLCDYYTAHPPADQAIREICELCLGLMGQFDTVIRSRVNADDDYKEYFAARQIKETEFFKQMIDTIRAVDDIDNGV